MSSKRLSIILFSGIALIAVIVGISLILTYGPHKTASSSLPEPEASASGGSEPTESGSVPNNGGLDTVVVNADNVQAVISSLLRRENYARRIKIENFFDGGSAVYNIDASVDGSDSVTKITGPDGTRHVILAAGMLYFWYEGDKDYHAGPAGAMGEEQSVSDAYQMTLTYEDVIKLDKRAITDAGYDEFGGELCIYVKYISGELKYTSTCYISVATGLLTGAEQYDGHRRVYRMTSSDYMPSVVDNTAFALPDGKNALSVP